MLTNTHIPTLVLALVIAATALGIFTTTNPKDIQIDLVAIETPPEIVQASGATEGARAWWNVLGKLVDRLN